MSEPHRGVPQGGRDPRRSPQLRALAVVIGLEAGGLIALTGLLIVDLFALPANSLLSAVALTAVTAIGAAWLVVMTLHTLQGRSWIRAAAVTVQVLLIAVALGSFQGIFARPDVGWALLAPAVVVLVLLFTPPVMRATRRTE